ncbi:hypothetical protein SPBR_05993 [Sporothrix brasiliensis 5110]|uniref:Uncharacterized protein n=1 Tax=Sporothrix brasiliensis 5110 TaxID=1398154 RepID=A0A0C2F6E0_9PEZI|nr:uncharacterized protein SPBR_05993 [Sporothrix brasiliensis 5110]KIH94509.1 hypothetical protein SPBR_05993 [Sporothrix brasiliensis 5110]
MAADCSVVPTSTPTAVALSISAVLIFSDTWGRAARQRKASGSSSASTSSFAIIGRKLLNSYSDQQIVTGIGIQSLGLSQISSLVPYHFFLIWMLGLLSTAVHNAALLALVHDFRRDWVLRWLRQALMFVNLALSCIYGIFVLRELAAGLPQTLPMVCALESGVPKNTTIATGDGKGGKSDTTAAWSGSAGAFQFIATVAVVAGNCVVFILSTWYLHSRAQRFYRIVQLVGLALMAAVAIGVAVRIVLLSQAFGHPSVSLSDVGETQWSFGQLLSLLMLLLPLISVVEIARGEIKVAPPVQDDGSGHGGSGDTVPLVEHQLPMGKAGHTSFQPTPFFSSSSRRTNSGR